MVGASYLAHKHLLFRFALVFGRLKRASLWAGYRRARASAGDAIDHSSLLSLPLTALLNAFVGCFKRGPVIETETERDRLAMQVSRVDALVAAPMIRLDPVEKADPL